MMTRRKLLKRGLLGGALATGALAHDVNTAAAASDGTWLMPDEGAAHAATWMAFGPSVDIWGRKLLPVARENLASIAKAIAAHEPVKMLVRAEEYDIAARLCGPSVTLVVQPIDDLWMRDTGPVFVKNQAAQSGAVGFNFNGWGGKQAHADDAEVASFISKTVNAEFIETDLVLEGGGIEVDGEGTAIITESCVLNANRNPGVSKAQCEQELSRLLGVRKVIWLPGIAGMDITDGHTDFYARFATPGVVVADWIWTRNPTTTPSPSATWTSCGNPPTSKDINWMWWSCRGRQPYVRPMRMRISQPAISIFMFATAPSSPGVRRPESDDNARDALWDLFPGRDIIQVNIDGIAAGGGGIHCTTQQQPA